MSRVAVLTIALVFLFVSIACAGKVLVRVYFDNPDHLKTVVSEFEDVAGWGGKRYADIVVTSEEMPALKAIAPNHEILIHDVEEHMRQVGVLGMGGAYHTQEETYADMDSIAQEYPTICMLTSIGTSIEGRDIWAMKVSDNVTVTENEPRVLYLGCHHAREIISIEIPLYILFWLTSNYGTDSLATYLVENREIWFVPLMNPDGREYVEHVGDWRKNRRDNGDGTYGIDLNRNWGYMWGYDDYGSDPNPGGQTYRGPSAFSEPETQTIRDLMLTYQFDSCISYHSHGRLILWAWGYIHDPCPDDQVFAALGDSMATYNGYAPQQGAELYPTNGDSDDWMYGEQTAKDKVFSYTFEVGTTFYPSVADLIPLCEENFEASVLAAEFADNIYRILAPTAPVITPMADDADGNYTVAWTPDLSDTSNPAILFALMERFGPGRVTDDVEAGNIHWDRRKWTVNTTRYHSGAQSFYGGRTNDRNARLTSLIGLDVAADDTLSFWTWYDIETDWDYAYVEVSTNGGISFSSIPGNITTNYNPNGSNQGNGITGSSSGWTEAVFPLGGFADSTILVRFRYKTDSYVLEEGIYVDDIFPVQTFDSTAVLSDNITETYYDVSRSIGTYYYEVKAMDDDGQWGVWSQRESITVTGAGIDDGVDSEVRRGFTNPVRLAGIVKLVSGALAGERVAIFDVQGRTVKVIDASRSGEITWDFKDEGGSLIAPGIYFISTSPDKKAATKKIVVLK